MSKPILLDLFCGAGGAAMGYHLAGFEVIGVDIEPQPNYPFRFVQGDAFDVLAGRDLLPPFHAVHASPPCQDHTPLVFTRKGEPHGTGWMLAAAIRHLQRTGLPYVIENVPGADMPGAFTLCGRSFGIRKLRRHRLFLTSFPMLVPPCACDGEQPIGIYGDLSKNDRAIRNTKDGYIRMRAGIETARRLLGCPWMEPHELTQAIPPVYTQFIGERLIEYVDLMGVASA